HGAEAIVARRGEGQRARTFDALPRAPGDDDRRRAGLVHPDLGSPTGTPSLAPGSAGGEALVRAPLAGAHRPHQRRGTDGHVPSSGRRDRDRTVHDHGEEAMTPASIAAFVTLACAALAACKPAPVTTVERWLTAYANDDIEGVLAATY